MKPSSHRRKPVSRAVARNAALVNQLATPGLGSLMGRRWVAGTGQLLMAATGFTLVLVWFVQMMVRYYGLMFSETQSPTPGLTLLTTGAVLFAASWLWAAVTSFSLLREISASRLRTLESMAELVERLDAARIVLALGAVPEWKRQGDMITRTFEFKDFSASMKFVDAVAEMAEQAWHHPDVDIRWNKVTLTLTTHQAGGLTEKDFALAQQFDRLQSAKN